MPISRVTAGYVLIGVSLFLLLYLGIRDDPELAIGIAWGAFLENSIAIIALVVLSFGIHFAFFSKPCPVCEEKLSRAAGECRNCGFNFGTAPEGRFQQMARATKVLQDSRSLRAKSRTLIQTANAAWKQSGEIMARSKELIGHSKSLHREHKKHQGRRAE